MAIRITKPLKSHGAQARLLTRERRAQFGGMDPVEHVGLGPFGRSS